MTSKRPAIDLIDRLFAVSLVVENPAPRSQTHWTLGDLESVSLVGRPRSRSADELSQFEGLSPGSTQTLECVYTVSDPT
jgi:hypothetical protein